MRKYFEETYHDIEKTHFWFKSRRNYILNLLKEYPKDATILDIGCSSGILLNELRELGFKISNLYGIDISEKAIHNCMKNGIQNSFVMDAQSIKLKMKFDVIIASDCLEHLEDDSKALNNWNQLLKHNGSLLIFVPAFMTLWSEHDVQNMHFRRYTKSNLKKKLYENDFKIDKSSYWNFFLFIPILTVRLLSKFKIFKNPNSTGNLKKEGKLLNSLFLTLINFENKLLKYINFPFGVSTYCIARKNKPNKIASF